MKIKKIICLVLAAVMLLSCTVTAFAAEKPQKQTYNYVALGDSIASGFGLTNPDMKLSIENLSSDPAAILTEDLLAHPVANAYPALFGDELQKIGDELGVTVNTTNLSMSGYRASDVAKIIEEDGYVSDTITMIFEDFLETDTAPFAKYHDYTERYLKDADLVSIHLGGNDILLNLMYSMHKEKNPILNATSMALCMILLGANMDFAMEMAQQEIENCGGKITLDDIAQAAELISNFSSSAEQYLNEASENVRDVVGAVRTKTANADIAIVNMYSPFGSSLEYEGQVRDLCTVMQNIIVRATDSEETDEELTDIIKDEISYPLQYLLVGKFLDSRIDVLNDGLRAVADETGCAYVDISDISNENNLDPHPTAKGHRDIADRLTATLTSVAFPEAFKDSLDMVEGDVIADFAEEGAICVSSDTSVAWVDENGALNAMKPGVALISNGSKRYTVTVSDYDDGSEVVGSLKLLARYNDSMQFYDGHVYLLFTSYQDGVTITVPDLYAAYEISDDYYTDIREDIANGSNHTDTNADKYFTFTKDKKSVTLDRGEIVTIGMYRDFDLSVPQAALGCVKNSSLWTDLVAAGKATVVENLFKFLDNGKIDADELLYRFKEILKEENLDYNKLLDGVVDGGVCFNRELYNQKLAWDQYENVTYEMDITKNQLNTMSAYLVGNLNKFSILKNSCATVALRAWNAAFGTRGGADTSYKLTSVSDGIFAFIDAPKGVRDNMVKRLPGYYLNNAQGVAEPGAGYQDDTGWVYVSAPEDVEPVSYVYADNNIRINDFLTPLTPLVNAAKAGKDVSYNKDSQEIGVEVKENAGVISGIDFTINGKTVTLDGNNMSGGIWFEADVSGLAEGEGCYVTDADGKALASEYDSETGVVCFYAETLPVSYKIVSSAAGAQNILRVVTEKADDADISAEVYYYKDGKKVVVDNTAELTAGTKVYVKPEIASDEMSYIIDSIVLGPVLIFDEEHYDAAEGAYVGVMPEYYAELLIICAKAELTTSQSAFIQMFVGDTLNIDDYAELHINDEEGYLLDSTEWKVVYDEDGAVAFNGGELKAVKEGEAVVWACAKSNENVGLPFAVEVFGSKEDTAKITFDEKLLDDFTIATVEEGGYGLIPYSGYLVKKGSELAVLPDNADSKAVLSVTCNGVSLEPQKTFTVTEDTEVKASLAGAEIDGIPTDVNLTEKGETYDLNGVVKYTGILGILPVYDSSITYISSDPIISVDDDGVMTVAGDIPENGALVYVTSYAGSSNNKVTATCRVTVGDYKGDRIVGRMTIHGRMISADELVPHGCLTFTPYEDVDLDVSYYEYYKPNDKYNALMRDYQDHPEKYNSDPALCNDNELGLENRESYFDIDSRGASSDPATISLKSGESITMSNYGFDSANIIAIMRALEDSDISSSKNAQALINQMYQYTTGGDFDTTVAFDSLVGTLTEIITISRLTGKNPANGHSEGGLAVNREIFNQFRRNDTQLPNNYYAIDITADEFAKFKEYIASPDQNYYSLFTMNCASGATNIWNTTLFDKPELHLSADYTGIAAEPESLAIEIGLMAFKRGLDGESGSNFYPRTLAHKMSYAELIEAIDALGEPVATEEYGAKLAELRSAYDELNDTEKQFVTNADKLAEAEEAYDEMVYAPLIEEFETYKAGVAAYADTLVKAGDSAVVKSVISAAKAVVKSLKYDKKLSLDENKARVDAIVNRLAKSLTKPEHPILGDVDFSSDVTIFDAAYIQRKIAGVPNPFLINDATADVDKDKAVSVVDVTLIQCWIANVYIVDGIGRPF